MSIGMAVPADMAEATGDRDMRWTSYRLMAIKARDSLENTEKSGYPQF